MHGANMKKSQQIRLVKMQPICRLELPEFWYEICKCILY